MKKWISLLLAGIILVQALSLVGCSKTLITADSLIYEIIPADTEGGIPTITLPEFDSDDVDSYEVPFKSMIKTYPAKLTYKEMLEERLKVTDGVDSLYLFQIVKVLTPDEAKSLVGYDDPYDNKYLFYESKLIYDYLRDDPVDETIYLRTSDSSGNQTDGNPPPQPGDTLVSFLNGSRNEGEIRIGVVASYIVDIDAATVDAQTAIYCLGGTYDDLKGLEAPRSSDERIVASGYTENPRRFGQKLILGDFVEFVKQDFEERGIVLQDREK